MIKSILVSLTGFDSDVAALETALLAGGPFGVHLDCLHVRPGPQQSRFGSVPNDFAGILASDLLQLMQQKDATHTKDAKTAFDFFRKRLDIPLATEPAPSPGVTAAWQELFGNDVDQTIAAARSHDLVVFGRCPDFTPVSPDAISHVVLQCGRPVLIAPTKAPPVIGHTIAIAWKDCAEAARAITAAMPLIQNATRTFIISAVEHENDRPAVHSSAGRLEEYFRWRGISTQKFIIDNDDGDAAAAVRDTARRLDADLLIMGAYGHGRMREIVFGGFTQSLLRSAPLPVLMFH